MIVNAGTLYWQRRREAAAECLCSGAWRCLPAARLGSHVKANGQVDRWILTIIQLGDVKIMFTVVKQRACCTLTVQTDYEIVILFQSSIR